MYVSILGYDTAVILKSTHHYGCIQIISVLFFSRWHKNRIWTHFSHFLLYKIRLSNSLHLSVCLSLLLSHSRSHFYAHTFLRFALQLTPSFTSSFLPSISQTYSATQFYVKSHSHSLTHSLTHSLIYLLSQSLDPLNISPAPKGPLPLRTVIEDYLNECIRYRPHFQVTQ